MVKPETSTEIHTLSLHDALPIAVHGRYGKPCPACGAPVQRIVHAENETNYCARDRKSTRLNSSHPSMSYAVFCLKKKTCLRDIEGTLDPGQPVYVVRSAGLLIIF